MHHMEILRKSRSWTLLGRFAAVAALEMRLGKHPNKVLLLQALAKHRLSRFDSLLDRILSELLISGECCTCACVIICL